MGEQITFTAESDRLILACSLWYGLFQVLNLLVRQEFMLYLGLGLPVIALTYLSLKKTEYSSLKPLLFPAYAGGIIYPVTESIAQLFIPGFQYLTTGPYLLDTPLHMSVLLVYTILLLGYISFRVFSAKLKHAQTYLFSAGFLGTFVIENFSAEAGMWWFSRQWLNVWHIPLCILLSETISLGLLHYFLRIRQPGGIIAFMVLSNASWVLFYLLFKAIGLISL